MPNRKILLLMLVLVLAGWVAPQVHRTMALQPEQGEPEESARPESFDSRTRVTVRLEGRTVDCSLQEYLVGVLCAELPADFPMDAWKAQAVAARSYALYKGARKPPESHGGAMLCGDYTCCTAFVLPEEAAEVWGREGQALADRAREAVAQTDGVVALWEGEPIGALWHAASCGHTASAREVWGTEVPYLQSVPSPGGEDSPGYRQELRISRREFVRRMTLLCPAMFFSGEPEGWFRDSVRTAGGYVQSVELGGVPVRGSWVRQQLGLASACFSYRSEGEELVFSTEGTGHGVGMSQYGAARLAREGLRWDEILSHYYKDVQLLKKS